MKKKINFSFGKLKMLLILPLSVAISSAFAKPDYCSSGLAFPTKIENSQLVNGSINGKVVNRRGKPLGGTSVVIKNSTIGTFTDINGEFKLEDVPNDADLVFSYLGLQTVVVKPDFDKPMTVKLIPVAIELGKIVVIGFGMNKTPSLTEFINKTGVDAVRTNNIDGSNPPKNGANEIFAKEKADGVSDQKNENAYLAAEEMPEFPGGLDGARDFVTKNIRYRTEAQMANAQGEVLVSFIVSSTGKVKNARIIKSVHPALDDEALRVIYLLPDWKPGKQHGEAVDVSYTLPVEFKLQ